MATETPTTGKSVDLQRSYGENWTKTNVETLFEWVAIAAFHIRCLDLGSKYYRNVIRNHTIFGLIVSTLSGTISVSQFGLSPSDKASITLNAIFAVLSFAIAIYTGFIKVYQIQERLELAIKLKQDWTVFSTAIASELQLPVELRRDALWIIIKNKTTYLDLLKMDYEVPDGIKSRVDKELPHPDNLHLNITTLPHIIMDIGIQELKDLQSAGARNKDRFSAGAGTKLKPAIPSIPELPTSAQSSPSSVTLEIHES